MSEEILGRLQTALGDRYQIQRELGRGGMATVFLATDIKHEREVAIKVLHPELSENLGVERFDREIKTVAKLQHPNILSLFDSGEADGLLYYVMPFVYGESLGDRLQREPMLPIETAVGITLEVADALGYAHSLGIVHRDIKPDNIMLSGNHALVADFGIAKAISSIEGSAKLTEAGVAVGTPLYMSPEQAVGDPAGPTSDLYSLACVLYEMLAGAPPFTGANARQIMARHAMEQVPSLQVIRDTVPDEVEDAIMATMAKVPADRPQTAAQFAEILGAQPGVTASRYSAMRVTAARRAARTGQIPLPEQPAAPPRKRWLVPAIAGGVVVAALGGFGAWKLLGGGAPAASVGGLDRHNIAVLYFDDLSQKKDLGYVADGLTEGLISVLGSVQGLTVVSRGGVAPYRGGAVPRDSIARALRVGTLVMGSVEPESDSLRVTLRLLDDAGTEMDRATFKKSGKDLIALSDSLSQEAAVLIRKRIGEAVQLSRTRAGTQNTDAWATYQRAVNARSRGDSLFQADDMAGFAREYAVADSFAALAEGLDPKWTDPIVLRGTLNYWRSRRATDDPGLANKTIDAGLEQAARALAIDRNSAEALELRGNLDYWRVLRDLEPDPARQRELFASAQRDLEQATQLNPSLASAYATLSHLYANHPGKTLVDVVLAATKALEKDAYLSNAAQVMRRLADANYDLGQFSDADRWCGEGRRRFPTSPRFAECELIIMTSKLRDPDPAAAWRTADTVVALTPDPVEQRYQRLNTRALVAGVVARAGQLDSARSLLRSIKPDPEADPASDVANTAAYMWLLAGDTTESLNQITAFLVANPSRKADFRDNPGWWFRGISEDPRYKAIVGSSR
ncbi:MAG: protein kinase [Gemmatimonadota bacterium]|nr:protein kinase [Gemmatimonadota bacterium]